MIFSIPYGPGDTYTLSTDRLEQVETLVSSSLILSGIVPGNRELSTTFRYKNPTTWSAWATLTDAALAAIVVDSDQGIYFEFQYERTGADTTGTIDVLRHDIAYTIDPTATVGPGRFTNMTLYADVVAFVNGYVGANLLPGWGGLDAFSVTYAQPAKCRPDARPMIYFHNLQLHDISSDTVGCTYRQRVSFRIGIKGQCDRDEDVMREQFSWLLAIFNPYYFNKCTFGITFKGEERIGILPYNLGVVEPARGAMIQLSDPDCNCIMNEFEASFHIIFPLDNTI